ncbi:MAG: hypothetical protein ACO4CW_05025 [Planctomycetota bacterium]|jgi:hypothetical protein
MMRKPRPSLLHRLLRENVRNKLVSLLFAITIWVFAFGNTGQEETIEVQVEIAPASPEQVILSQTADSKDGPPFDGFAKITLSASRSLLNSTLRGVDRTALVGRIVVTEDGLIDLADRAHFPEIPPAMTVKQTEPVRIHVSLDELETRELKVNRGSPSFSTSRRFLPPKQGDFLFEPNQVGVTGPKSLLGGVEVRLGPLQVTEYDAPAYDSPHPIVLENAGHPAIRFAEGVEPEVRVRVTLRTALEQREFQIPIHYSWSAARKPGPFDLPVGDAEIGMTCRGTEPALDQLAERVRDGEFRILITLEDFSGAVQSVRSDEFTWPAGSLPPGIEQGSIQFSRGSVAYRVERIVDRSNEEDE